jgi:hypothetical protein
VATDRETYYAVTSKLELGAGRNSSSSRGEEEEYNKEEIMPKLQCVISCLCAHSRWVICSLFPNRESPSRDKI